MKDGGRARRSEPEARDWKADQGETHGTDWRQANLGCRHEII